MSSEFASVHSDFSFESLRRQAFSFPFNFICYLAERPSRIKGYQKLQQTCKYFFSKTKIVIVDRNVLYKNKSLTCKTRNIVKLPLEKKLKYWLPEFFAVNIFSKNGIIDFINDHIYKFELKGLGLAQQNIPLEILESLLLIHGGQIWQLILLEVILLDANNIPISWTSICRVLSKLPCLKYFVYFKFNESVTSKMIKNLSQVKLKSKLQDCTLHFNNVAENVDVSLFCDFIKNNAAPSAKFLIRFNEFLPEAAMNSLNIALTNMRENWEPSTATPNVTVRNG